MIVLHQTKRQSFQSHIIKLILLVDFLLFKFYLAKAFYSVDFSKRGSMSTDFNINWTKSVRCKSFCKMLPYCFTSSCCIGVRYEYMFVSREKTSSSKVSSSLVKHSFGRSSSTKPIVFPLTCFYSSSALRWPSLHKKVLDFDRVLTEPPLVSLSVSNSLHALFRRNGQ